MDMTMHRIIHIPASPEQVATMTASVAYARSLNPVVLAEQIAEQNTPEKVAALYARLASYRRRRLAAERGEDWRRVS